MPTRDIPTRPWVRIGRVGVLRVTLLMAAWEWTARTRSAFAPATSTTARKPGPKRAARADHAQVAIVGDSRILFDTDQARFQALTGVRPVQVSMLAPTPAPCSSISPTTRISTDC